MLLRQEAHPSPSPPSLFTGPMWSYLLQQPRRALSHQTFHPPVNDLTLQVPGSGNDQPLPEAETLLPAPPAPVDCVPPPLLPPGGILATLREEPHPGKCWLLHLDSHGPAGAEKLRGIVQELLCAWIDLDKDTYLGPLSLKVFSFPLCEMVT